MPRLLSALVLLAVAGIAAADIAPPPPPKGQKYVDVSSEVLLGKDVNVSGWVFVVQEWKGPGRPVSTVSKVELSEKKAVAVSGGGRRTSATLFAVPEAVAKEYKTDKELFAAVEGGKLKGVQKLAFEGSATVTDKVKGDTVTWTHTITGVDDKGIKSKVSGDGKSDAPDKPGEKPAKPVGFEPGVLIGGMAAALAVCLGGLWLVRRRK